MYADLFKLFRGFLAFFELLFLSHSGVVPCLPFSFRKLLHFEFKLLRA